MVLQVLVALHYLVKISILARFGIILQSVSFWQALSMLMLWLDNIAVILRLKIGLECISLCVI